MTGSTQACSSTPANPNRNTGACHEGIQYCNNGFFGPCTGEVLSSAESCNAVDDDCNGVVDDGLGQITCGTGVCLVSVAACTNGKPQVCNPGTPAAGETCNDALDNNCNGLVNEGCGCVYVSPNGSDVTGTGSATLPYKTIQFGISQAGGARPTTVCVGSTANCTTAPATTTYGEAVTMKDGISVLGGYESNITSVAWTRNVANCQTKIAAQTAAGVTFDATVVNATLLDGFLVDQGRATDPISAAVTIIGSTGAVLANNVITGGGATTESYGVRVTDNAGAAATPKILGNAIVGGAGPTAIGVGSTKSAPVIRNNCDSALNNAGHCPNASCSSTTSPATVGHRFIRGRNTAAGTTSYGVNLVDSANAQIEVNGISASNDCGGVGGVTTSNDAAAIHVAGAAAGMLIRGNTLLAFRGGAAHFSAGILLDPCLAASPWIFDNERITGSTTVVGGFGDGIRAVGDCHPRVDSNVLIMGGQESASTDTNGVHCAKDPATGIASQCVIVNNLAPASGFGGLVGSASGFPPNSAGVRCDDGACARIDNNSINGRAGINSFGVILNNTGTFVNRNTIEAGCPTQQGVGIEATNAFARIQNNIVRGVGTCAGSVSAAPSSWAMRVFNSSSTNELDVHSNDLLAYGPSSGNAVCRALSIGGAPAGPTAPQGIYRNNILHAGFCPTAYAVEETSAAADPRIFENNDLFTTGNSSGQVFLYRDEATTNYGAAQIATINALPGFALNIPDDPQFTAPSPFSASLASPNYHLKAGSKCIDNGTSAGAIPGMTDFFGVTRPVNAKYDIGAAEQ